MAFSVNIMSFKNKNLQNIAMFTFCNMSIKIKVMLPNNQMLHSAYWPECAYIKSEQSKFIMISKLSMLMNFYCIFTNSHLHHL